MKKIRAYTVFLLLLLLGSQSVLAQSNLRKKKLIWNADTIQLDTFSIAFQSFSFKNSGGNPIDTNIYKLDPWKAQLIKKQPGGSDTVFIEYRVLPIQINKAYKHKSFRPTDPNQIQRPILFTYTPPKSTGILTNDGLNKSGSISRGITFGNNQDLAVNSFLNLQLSGKIKDDIQVMASVSDDNIPIQPDGNTAQLQDFDQVYIKVFEDKWSLTAGDLWMKRPDSYFLRYQKRVQGLSATLNLGEKNKWNYQMQTGGAISKGKFARNVIQGREGTQGPYRLVGSENETFIIILGGTEQVFIDGQLMKRGQEYDYVIDYNTAEITFTARHLITKDRRIVVEFQYSDKNYARSIITSNHVWTNDKWKIYGHFYNEEDAKNQPLQLSLTDADKQVMANIGDSINQAYNNSIDSVGFSGSQVMYKMVDSLGYDSVLVFSVNADSAYYHAVFSFVGQGNGDYVQSEFTALGKTFKWVAPDTVGSVIVKQGNYAPLMRLVTPKARRMATAGFEWKPDKNSRFALEGAWSYADVNKFSKLHKPDNDGWAIKAHAEKNFPLQKKEKPLLLTTKLGGEFVSNTFNRIERFRAVEFERNWNINTQNVSGDQIIGEAFIGLAKEGKGMWQTGAETFISGTDYTGIMAKTTGNIHHKGFRANGTGSYLFTSGIRETKYMRHKAFVAQKLGKFEIGFKDDHEWNRFMQTHSDSLTAGSYRWYDYEVFAGTHDTTGNGITVSYRQRFDWMNDSGKLESAARANQYHAMLNLAKNRGHKLRITAGYRELKILDAALISQAPENTFLGRLEYNLRAFKNSLVAATFYETASGLELKKEFIYIEVPAGQGNYTWIDYNANGIKELNEFEIAAFPDQATYIRSFTPSNEYVRTYTNQFNQSLALSAPAKWSGQKGFKKLVSRFSTQSYYRSERKTSNVKQEEALNPFDNDIADSSLVSSTSSTRNTVYFNRSSSVFGMDYTWQLNDQKILLTNGFESRKWLHQEAKMRLQIKNKIIFTQAGETGIRGSNSDFLNGRNYQITYYTIKPELAWQPGTTFRLSAKYTYTEKHNTPDFGGETAFINDYGTEMRVSANEKGSFLAQFNYIIIKYDGTLNNSLSFEMLNALKPGNNMTWSAVWQQSLGKNMQLNLTYNGRKTEGNKSIHTGGVQVRAFF